MIHSEVCIQIWRNKWRLSFVNLLFLFSIIQIFTNFTSFQINNNLTNNSSNISLSSAYELDFQEDWKKSDINGISIQENYLFLSIGNYDKDDEYTSEILILDISNPTNPVFISKTEIEGNAQDICVKGDYAYIAAGDAGLAIVEITDKEKPKEKDYKYTHAYVKGIDVDKSYAYITSNNGSYIADISDPEDLGSELNETINVSGSKIMADDDYVFISTGRGAVIVDISDLNNIKNLNSISADGKSYGLYHHEGYLYLALDEYGMGVCDVSDPSDLGDMVYGKNEDEHGYNVIIYKNYAFIAGGDVSSIYDITNPEKLKLYTTIGEKDENLRALDICISNNYVFIADDYDGLLIINLFDLIGEGDLWEAFFLPLMALISFTPAIIGIIMIIKKRWKEIKEVLLSPAEN